MGPDCLLTTSQDGGHNIKFVDPGIIDMKLKDRVPVSKVHFHQVKDKRHYFKRIGKKWPLSSTWAQL